MRDEQRDSKTSQALERKMTIRNKYGIHARPAALFVKMVSQFQCDVTVERENMTASGKSIMGLLTIEGYQGAVLTVRATGADAKACLDALQELVDKKFYED